MVVTASWMTDEAPWRTMGKPGSCLLDLGQDVEPQGRRDEDAAGVPGALLGLEFIGAVGGADGDGQRVDRRPFDEVDDLLRLGVGRVLRLDLVLDPGQAAELAFDRDAEGAGEIDDLARQGDILLIGEVRAVDHDRREAVIDAGLGQIEGVAVVEVEGDGDGLVRALGLLHLPGHAHRPFGHVAEEGLVGVLPGAARDLEDDRRARLGAGRDDGLELFHIVEIVGRHRVPPGEGAPEHVVGVGETDVFIRDGHGRSSWVRDGNTGMIPHRPALFKSGPAGAPRPGPPRLVFSGGLWYNPGRT